jgi:hypothetical protein
MSEPVIYPKPKRIKDKSGRRWHVAYDLAYDGGGSRWTGHYRTWIGARIAIAFNLGFASWGGTAALTDTEAARDAH